MILLLLACDGSKVPGAEDGLLHNDLGTFTTDASGEVDVTVEVEKGSFSALLSCGPYGFDLSGSVVSILDPSGTAVYDGTAPETGYLRVPASIDQLAVLLPTSPGLPLSAGTWTVRIAMARTEPTTIACETVQRNGEIPTKSSLELHFVFVGTDVEIAGMNATGALSNASFSAMLAETKRLWTPAFQVDPVTSSDFEGEPAGYASVSDLETLGGLLRSAEDARSLSVFVVPKLSLDGVQTDVGQLAPIGTVSIGGTSRSGLVLSLENLAADPAGLGQSLASAGASFMGLFPVISAEGADPLDDTPVCGELDTAACAGQGAENLLWPLGGGNELSADQIWVLQRSPLLQ